MSDSPEVYMQKVRVLLGEVSEKNDRIQKEFTVRLLTQVILQTRGPGNQFPSTAVPPYEATGRMVAGWNLTTAEAPAAADRFDGGPYDIGGSSIYGPLVAQIRETPLPASYSLWNEVGYAYLVHEGRGRHHGTDRWTWRVADPGNVAIEFEAAVAEVLARG